MRRTLTQGEDNAAEAGRGRIRASIVRGPRGPVGNRFEDGLDAHDERPLVIMGCIPVGGQGHDEDDVTALPTGGDGTARRGARDTDPDRREGGEAQQSTFGR